MRTFATPLHRLTGRLRATAGALCAAACLSIPALAAPTGPSGPVLDQIRAQGRIVLAHRESSVPFSYLGPGQKPMGYALDICRRLAAAVQQRLGLSELPIEYRLVTPANRMEAIESGQAQLECGSTTNNAARREKVAFTIPHFITGARLLVKAGSPIDRLDHPGIKTVASTRNTTPLAAVKRVMAERALRFTLIETEDHEKGVQMVERGEADAFVMDDVLLYGLASTRPNPRALQVVGRFLTTEPLAIMLPKGDPAFKKIVDEEMRRLIFSREIHAIYQQWFEKPIPPTNLALGLAPSYLLRDLWKFPTDQVP